MLASGSYDNTIILWDVFTGNIIRTFKGHTDLIFSVSFSPDGTMLASGSGDKTINLWDVATGNIIKTLKGHTDWVNSVIFSPEGSTLASGSSDGTIRLWRITTSPNSVESSSINCNKAEIINIIPNPAQEHTKIVYFVSKPAYVSLSILDIFGREVIPIMHNTYKESGFHSFELNTTNLSAGIYFCQLIAEGQRHKKTMIITK